MRELLKVYIISISIFFLLYGCGGIKEKVGLIKKAPDEFQVYKKKPLSVPPNFDLRPPSDGEIVKDEDNNEEILFSNEDKKDENLTLSDEILLIAIGEKNTEKNIRKTLNEDNSIEEVDKSIIDKILDFDITQKVKVNDGKEEIDAEKEKERIEKLEKEGKIIKVENQAIIIEKEGSLD